MWKAVACPIGLSTDVEPAIELRGKVRQANRVDLEDRRRVGVVADPRRIAGYDQQVAHLHRVRAEQVRLHADHVAVTAGVVKNRFDAGLLLHHDRGGERAHAPGGPRAVGHVDEIDAVNPELAGLFDERLRQVASRRHELDADHERSARERVAHARLLRPLDPGWVFGGAHRRYAVDGRRDTRPRTPRPTTLGDSARTACLI